MLTIKIRAPNGNELTKEVISVMYRNAKESESGNPCVSYFALDGAVDVFEGQIWVMNRDGKTIADYELHYPTMKIQPPRPWPAPPFHNKDESDFVVPKTKA